MLLKNGHMCMFLGPRAWLVGVHDELAVQGEYPGWCRQVGTRRGVLPTQYSDWYCQGPTNASTGLHASRPGTPGPAGPSAHLVLLARSRVLLQPIWARFHHKYTKVSGNPGVSPKSGHEACHAPCFKSRSIMHDLEFLRFPLWPAFSHKE